MSLRLENVGGKCVLNVYHNYGHGNNFPPDVVWIVIRK